MVRLHVGLVILGSFGWACSGAIAEHVTAAPNVDVGKVSRDANPDVLTGGPSSSDLGDMRLRPEICQGIELTPERQTLSVQSIVDYMKRQGFESKLEYARDDLTYVEVMLPEGAMRLRVATLLSPQDAGRELHEAILQHGPGSWGIHRSNLAVLGAIGSVNEILALNQQTKLACWGVLTVSGLDDSFVVPGGYTEL